MPPFIALALILLVITPPCYGILVILLDTQTPPRQRTTRAVGGAILFKSAGVGSLMFMTVASQAQLVYILPTLLVFLTILAVTRIMQLEFKRDFELKS
ncbi:MAG: hypothetical protein HND46_14990 [Chloroflexi bacterium]|nr:hypothetical protein [Chloroflexota bacterium]NOG64718.1 hypothetical protein [Chloroflexota bacterium]